MEAPPPEMLELPNGLAVVEWRRSARARQKFTATSTSSTMNGIADSVGGGAPSRRRLQDSTRMPPAST